MTSPSVVARRTSPSKIATWALQIVVGLAFIVAGGAKLAGAPQMVAIFDQIGVGQWFRIVTGLVEVTGGLLLLWPGRSAYGALLLTATMTGALFTHAVKLGGTWQPAAVLFVCSALLLWLNRAQLTQVAQFGRSR